MADTGGLEAKHDVAQFRMVQPLRTRRRSTPRSAYGSAIGGARTLAGHHQDNLGAARLRGVQEMHERVVRFALRVPVQVDAAVDRGGAARQAAPRPPFQRRERRGLFLGWRCRHARAGAAGEAGALAGCASSVGSSSTSTRLSGLMARVTVFHSAFSSALSRRRRSRLMARVPNSEVRSTGSILESVSTDLNEYTGVRFPNQSFCDS